MHAMPRTFIEVLAMHRTSSMPIFFDTDKARRMSIPEDLHAALSIATTSTSSMR